MSSTTDTVLALTFQTMDEDTGEASKKTIRIKNPKAKGQLTKTQVNAFKTAWANVYNAFDVSVTKSEYVTTIRENAFSE